MSTQSKKKYATEEERKAARKASQKKYEDANRGNNKKRETHLKRRYGLTCAQWDAMFYQQGCCCDICGTHALEYTGNWDVDHCHATGKVRGILCHSCNTLLGQARDNSHTLAQAIHYLEKHNG